MLVPDLVWLVIEDAASPTEAVAKLLIRLQIPFVHLTGTSSKQHNVEKEINCSSLCVDNKMSIVASKSRHGQIVCLYLLVSMVV